MPAVIIRCLISLLLSIATFHIGIAHVSGAKVLFTFYHDTGSHFRSMLPLMEKLAQQGHTVQVLDTIFPPDTNLSHAHRLAQQGHTVQVLDTIFPPDTNLSQLVTHIRATLPPENEGAEEAKAFFDFFWNETDTALTLPEYFGHGDAKLALLKLNHSEKIAQLINEQWDLIVMDDLFWCFGFALSTLKQRLWDAHRQGPEPRSIVYATAGQTLLSADSVKAASRNWVSKSPLFPFIPTDHTDVYSPGRFTHRLYAFYENFAEHLLMNWFVERFMLPTISRFGVPNFSWHEMYRRNSLLFSDSIDRMGWPLAQGTEMVNLGAHCKMPKKLPEEFRRFIEDPKSKGTIYVAFGTYPEWSMAPPRILSALIGAFNRLTDYRIVFSYNGPPIDGIGKHIMLAKWAPQVEILAHPNTKAYVTHGGLKSVREGLCAGVPLVVMPLFAEQAHNAHLVLAMGIGPLINKYTLTADSVHATIHRIVAHPECKQRAQHFRALFLDRLMPSLDEGAFWVGRLLRLRPGRRANFPRKGMYLGWPEFGYLDLGGILLATVLLLTFGGGSRSAK